MEIKVAQHDQLEFSIYYELDPSIKYVEVTLPTNEFIISLLRSLKHFFVTMIHDYKVDLGREGLIDRVESLLNKYQLKISNQLSF